MTFLRKNGPTPKTIAPTSIVITPKHHSMQIKQVRIFSHGAQNTFIPRNPHKCLFPGLGIEIWVLLLELKWAKLFFTSRAYVVREMKYVNDFVNFTPKCVIRCWKG